MNKLKYIALSLLLGLAGTSCEDILEDNVNPDAAPGVAADNGLPVVIFYAAQINYDHAEYNVYLSQCLTTTGKTSTGSYGYKNGWEFLTMNRHPQWRRHFYDIGANVNELLRNAEAISSPNYTFIARVIRLMSTQLTTDAFGDMPRSNAYLSNSPTYDTQASIYAWMLEEADALINGYKNGEFNSDLNQEITVNEDRVYAGDLNKWLGLVYAVKARILLRNIPNVDTSAGTLDAIIAAADEAINIWQADPMYGAFFGSEPRYNFDGGTQQQNCPWSDAQPIINTWESRANLLTDAVPSKFLLADCMGAFNQDNELTSGAFVQRRGYADDPRASLLFKPRTGPASATSSSDRVKLRWLENNIGCGTSFKTSNFPDLYAGAYAGTTDSYVPLFTMEELYFIKAEAEYWKGNKAGACALAKEATRYNIQRHLEAFQKKYPDVLYPGNVLASGEYQAIDVRPEYAPVYWQATVDAFLDDATMPEKSPEGTTYSNRVYGVTNEKTPGNHHWYFNESEYTLSDLMIQKYIAMYMQPEQWTDLRRYHYSNNRNGIGAGSNNEIVYPTLRRPYNLYAPYWIDGLSTADQEKTWIQRINYDPETEEKYNRLELERLGAYKNYEWLRKPMIWAEDPGVRTSLTAE